MKLLQRLRIESVLIRYSWWLDIFGVGGKQRRRLRRELRSNLIDAAADRGAGPAIVGLGNLRTLATEYAVDSADTPRWRRALAFGVGAFSAVILVMFLAAANYTDGALDAGLDGRTEGPLFPFPGAKAAVDSTGDGLSFTVSPGWTPIVAGLLVFLLMAKPWRGSPLGSDPAR